MLASLSTAPVPDHRVASSLRSPCDLEIVVPTYNEERRLPATLDALFVELDAVPQISARVVVVDNGSYDRTAEAADLARARHGDERVHVIGCSVGGKGAAVRRGVLGSSATWVGFVDADLATPAATLHPALAALASGDDVVIASRRCAGARYDVAQPLVRRAGSWAFRFAVRDLLPDVADTQCGFKFFTRAAARRIFAGLQTHGFSFDVEVLARAHAMGYAITEVPVVWSDDPDSSLRAMTHAGEIAREILRLRRLRHDGTDASRVDSLRLA